jgi:hypothetical protein
VERGFTGDFFEVTTSVIKSQYSQVVWGELPPVDIPADVQAKFASGVMAVTGHEVNVIRIGPNGEETSVPCTESYNHHCEWCTYTHAHTHTHTHTLFILLPRFPLPLFPSSFLLTHSNANHGKLPTDGAFIKGKGVDAVILSPEERNALSLAELRKGGVRFIPNGRGPGTGMPTTGTFSEHNGNEARQTYHGLPPGQVVLVEAPEQFLFSPMQIK